MRDIEAIRRCLPLRYPYLMVDRIVEEEEGRVVALKNVTINEPFFQGHFPEPLEAVMPGTLMIEAMAQTASFLALPPADEPAADGGSAEGFLVGVEKARVRRKVIPGDQLRIEATLIRRKRGLLQAQVTGTVDGETAVSAVISLMLAG